MITTDTTPVPAVVASIHRKQDIEAFFQSLSVRPLRWWQKLLPNRRRHRGTR